MGPVVVLVTTPIDGTDSIKENASEADCNHDPWLIVESKPPSVPRLFIPQGIELNYNFKAAMVELAAGIRRVRASHH